MDQRDTLIRMETVPGTVLLRGIVGSTAYGLAGPDSDVDRLGIFAADTVRLFELHPLKDSVVTTAPDSTMHEAAKAVRLMLGGNPTALEILFLPDELYEVRAELGDELIGIRSAFLSAKRVRDAYLGYASQQFRKLENRGDGSFSSDLRKRTAKHARHLARLLRQGVHLHATGELIIRLDDPQWYINFGDEVAAGNVDLARQLLRLTEMNFDDIPSALPERPDEAAVQDWLRRVRLAHLAWPA